VDYFSTFMSILLYHFEVNCILNRFDIRLSKNAL